MTAALIATGFPRRDHRRRNVAEMLSVNARPGPIVKTPPSPANADRRDCTTRPLIRRPCRPRGALRDADPSEIGWERQRDDDGRVHG